MDYGFQAWWLNLPFGGRKFRDENIILSGKSKMSSWLECNFKYVLLFLNNTSACFLGTDFLLKLYKQLVMAGSKTDIISNHMDK